MSQSSFSDTPAKEPETKQLNVSEYPTVLGVPTHVLQYGTLGDSVESLVLIIPGNPGVPDFYAEYMEIIYKGLGEKVPVWAVAHAGHVPAPKQYKGQYDPVGNPFTLEGQTQHKVAFIQEHIPKNLNLVLIGHSIGCQIIIEIMKRLPKWNIIKSYLLFPTIERMAVSPQGQYATPLLRYARWLAYPLTLAASYLPKSLQEGIIRKYMSQRNVPECTIKGALCLFDAACQQNSMYMANDEMQLVREPDLQGIRENLDKILFYYGLTDHWCPVEYYHDMKKIFPQGNIILCEKGYEHAFVLESSVGMAELTIEWLKCDLE
ncbi:unnamed protein product [Owenia fusiformis]|uniref:Lipid droplet-associated hydrolase n=1 Tax=Owenia fusiformis TaxID=6347 RepID=A0A8J1UAC3_OWEFU|nr:unnamed protein product [Owenia fusiformis]